MNGQPGSFVSGGGADGTEAAALGAASKSNRSSSVDAWRSRAVRCGGHAVVHEHEAVVRAREPGERGEEIVRLLVARGPVVPEVRTGAVDAGVSGAVLLVGVR